MSIPLEEPFPLSGGMQILAGAKIVEAGGGRARQFFYSCSSLCAAKMQEKLLHVAQECLPCRLDNHTTFKRSQ